MWRRCAPKPTKMCSGHRGQPWKTQDFSQTHCHIECVNELTRAGICCLTHIRSKSCCFSPHHHLPTREVSSMSYFHHSSDWFDLHGLPGRPSPLSFAIAPLNAVVKSARIGCHWRHSAHLYVHRSCLGAPKTEIGSYRRFSHRLMMRIVPWKVRARRHTLDMCLCGTLTASQVWVASAVSWC
jgi:hypothetical protein